MKKKSSDLLDYELELKHKGFKMLSDLLITGRVTKTPELEESEQEIIHAVLRLLGGILINQRLKDIIIATETDDLTALWNRRAFQIMTENYLYGAEEANGAYMMIDLDYFKEVNDTYGHLIGDQVLRDTALAMKSVLRESDFIGRKGGDEFAILCRGITTRDQAFKKAETVLNAIRQVTPEGAMDHITASIGVALTPFHGKTFTELYNKADEALYVAKARGRNCCVVL